MGENLSKIRDIKTNRSLKKEIKGLTKEVSWALSDYLKHANKLIELLSNRTETEVNIKEKLNKVISEYKNVMDLMGSWVVSPLSVHRLWNQDGRQEFSGGPNVIGEPSSHGWGALLPTYLFC